MSARGWWWATIGWLVLVGVGWTAWFASRAAEVERAQAKAEAAWVAQVRALNAVVPDDPPRTPPAPSSTAETEGTSALRDRLARDVEALAFERFHDADRERARAYVAHALTASGWAPSLQAFGAGVNVVASQRGRDPGAGEVLLGAHLDTVAGTVGADDNASGVAVVLAAARRFAGRETARGLRIVLFDSEERGLLGSRAYCADPERLSGLVAAVVVEMVGFSCPAPGCQRAPAGLPRALLPSRGDFLGVVGDLEHLELLAPFRRATGPGRPAVRVLPVPAKGQTLPDTRRSDHAPFWDAGVGAVMVTDTAELRSPHYHQPTDRPETIDREFLRGSAEIVLDAVAEMLEARATPAAAPPTQGSSR